MFAAPVVAVEMINDRTYGWDWASLGRYQLAGQTMLLGFAVAALAAGVDALLRRQRAPDRLHRPVAALPPVDAWDDPVR